MFSIDVDLREFRDLGQRLAGLREVIQAAIQQQLLVIQTAWLTAVQGEQLPGMTKRVVNEEYAASITDAASLEYPFNGDPFAGRVVSTNPAVAWRVEHGYPSFDMKPGLLAGPAAKHGESGPYTTVPFTHGTAGTVGVKAPPMPEEVSTLATALSRGGRLMGMGDLGRRSKLPGPINAANPLRPPMQGPYTWKASPFQGMVRGGRAGHTTYTTFRRVSAQSDPSSWIHPGQEPNRVMEAVQDAMAERVQAAIVAAVQAALEG